MTQIGGFIPPTRRPDLLGVHSLDHFSLTVPDMEVAKGFYGGFGLEVRAQGGALQLHTVGSDHRWGTLVEGRRKKLHHVSFGAFADDIERFKERLERLGIGRLDPPAGFASNGLWCRDPDGTLVEIRVAEKCSPNAKAAFAMASSPAGVAGAPNRTNAPVVQPRRLAHVLLFSSDVARQIRFYEQALGLRLSDRSGEGIAFMHGVHGSDHHVIAFAKSDGPGLHHCSWDVASINEIGLGAMQMADKGFVNGWGLGRHVLGSNYFHYVQDPWGSFSEYSSDIDYIPCGQDWQAGDHPPHDAFYVWGPTPPEDFVKNYEAG
jgi:catechol 2,3-dioxygenase